MSDNNRRLEGLEDLARIARIRLWMQPAVSSSFRDALAGAVDALAADVGLVRRDRDLGQKRHHVA